MRWEQALIKSSLFGLQQAFQSLKKKGFQDEDRRLLAEAYTMLQSVQPNGQKKIPLESRETSSLTVEPVVLEGAASRPGRKKPSTPARVARKKPTRANGNGAGKAKANGTKAKANGSGKSSKPRAKTATAKTSTAKKKTASKAKTTKAGSNGNGARKKKAAPRKTAKV